MRWPLLMLCWRSHPYEDPSIHRPQPTGVSALLALRHPVLISVQRRHIGYRDIRVSDKYFPASRTASFGRTVHTLGRRLLGRAQPLATAVTSNESARPSRRSPPPAFEKRITGQGSLVRDSGHMVTHEGGAVSGPAVGELRVETGITMRGKSVFIFKGHLRRPGRLVPTSVGSLLLLPTLFRHPLAIHDTAPQSVVLRIPPARTVRLVRALQHTSDGINLGVAP